MDNKIKLMIIEDDKQINKGEYKMKSKCAFTLCIGMLILSTAACQNKKDTVDVASTEPITTIISFLPF